MSAQTDTKPNVPASSETVAQKRSRVIGAIREALAGIAKSELAIGQLLLEVRPTFFAKGKLQREAFFSWIEKNVSLKQAAAYRYMQAAETVARVPSIAAATTAIESLAFLSRMPDDEIEATVKAAGRKPTLSALQQASETVSVRMQAAAERRDASDAQKAEEDRVKADKAVGRIRTKVAKTFASDLVRLEALSDADPYNAVRLAMLHGADLVAKHGPDATAVIRELLRDEVSADAAANADDAAPEVS